MPRITCITRIWQAEACFLKHELSLINHELTINGWRGLLMSRRKRGKRRVYFQLFTALNSKLSIIEHRNKRKTLMGKQKLALVTRVYFKL